MRRAAKEKLDRAGNATPSSRDAKSLKLERRAQRKRSGSVLIRIENSVAYFFAHGVVQTMMLLGLTYLSCHTSAEKNLPPLIKKLQSADVETRNQAALALAPYGERAKPAVPGLIRLLGDPNTGVRSSAAYALREIGTPEANTALDNYGK